MKECRDYAYRVNVNPLSVSICIPSYNEEKTIAHVLKLVLKSIANMDKGFEFKEITVISESTDRTNEIVKDYTKLDSRIKLIENSNRLGLSGAISLFLKKAESDIVVVIDADVFLKPTSLKALLKPFHERNANVYATSGRKIPISNCPIVQAFWKVHHELCILHPKLCSSIIAFRSGVVSRIPWIFGTPDTYLMLVMEKRGLRIVYVPNAEGKTIEPNNLKDFIKQRKRIHVQHLFLKRVTGYNPPAFKFQLYARALVKAMLSDKGNFMNYLACAVIELFCRFMGLLVFKREGLRSYVWEKVR